MGTMPTTVDSMIPAATPLSKAASAAITGTRSVISHPPRFDELLDPVHLDRRVGVDSGSHSGVVHRCGRFHLEVLEPPHLDRTVDGPVLPTNVHVLERSGLHTPGV